MLVLKKVFSSSSTFTKQQKVRYQPINVIMNIEQHIDKQIFILIGLSIIHVNSIRSVKILTILFVQKMRLMDINLFEISQDIISIPMMSFNTYWYRYDAKKQSLNFNRLSSEFLTFFNNIFREYYEGRLKSRGAKIAWNWFFKIFDLFLMKFIHMYMLKKVLKSAIIIWNKLKNKIQFCFII